jgi:hypothetical protein
MTETHMSELSRSAISARVMLSSALFKQRAQGIAHQVADQAHRIDM